MGDTKTIRLHSVSTIEFFALNQISTNVHLSPNCVMKTLTVRTARALSPALVRKDSLETERFVKVGSSILNTVTIHVVYNSPSRVSGPSFSRSITFAFPLRYR